MDCEKYRRTHFVEVRPCCAIDAERLLGPDSKQQVVLDVLRRADPDVWSKIAGEVLAASLTRALGKSPGQIIAQYKKDNGIRE